MIRKQTKQNPTTTLLQQKSKTILSSTTPYTIIKMNVDKGTTYTHFNLIVFLETESESWGFGDICENPLLWVFSPQKIQMS
jgi:hypothetical protein